MNLIYTVVGYPLGFIMWFFYLITKNFGISIIIFTFVARLAQLPFTVKNQKNMAKSQLFMPRVKQIQSKYRSDNVRMQEEMAKLQKEGYNPMGGCGYQIVPLILLFGMLDVVYKPMTHLEHFEWAEKGSTAQVETISKQLEYAEIISGAGGDDMKYVIEFTKNADYFTAADVEQVQRGDNVVPAVSVSPDDWKSLGGLTEEQMTVLSSKKDSKLSEKTITELIKVNSRYKQMQRELYTVSQYSRNPEIFAQAGVSQTVLSKLAVLEKNFMFAGIDLGSVPKAGFNSGVVIPVVAFIFAVCSTIVTVRIQHLTMPEMEQSMNGSMKMMMYSSPIISLLISFSVPAGAGLYWAAGYLVSIGQSLILLKFWPMPRLKEQAKIELERRNVKYQTYIEVEAEKVADADTDVKAGVNAVRLADLSKREQEAYYRKRLEAARAADAAKYGDVPDDLTFDDK